MRNDALGIESSRRAREMQAKAMKALSGSVSDLDARCRYLERELAVACARIQTLDAQVKSLQMAAPRGIPSVQPEGDEP